MPITQQRASQTVDVEPRRRATSPLQRLDRCVVLGDTNTGGVCAARGAESTPSGVTSLSHSLVQVDVDVVSPSAGTEKRRCQTDVFKVHVEAERLANMIVDSSPEVVSGTNDFMFPNKIKLWKAEEGVLKPFAHETVVSPSCTAMMGQFREPRASVTKNIRFQDASLC